MAEKIQRHTQKIFGGNAPTDDLAVFGSFKTGNPIYTDNIGDLQSPAYEKGWSAALAANEAPFMEEMNGVQYVFSKQLAYLFQEGIPEYDANTEYFTGAMAKGFNTDNVPVIYRSLTDNNIGNDLSNAAHWEVWLNGAAVDLSNLSQAGIDKIKEYATAGGTSLPLFSLVYQDHVLSAEESKGLSLLGSYVYKNAAPGREGYPAFYNRCLEEYQNSTTPFYLASNVNVVGALSNNNGIFSGFSTANYLKVPVSSVPEFSSFESCIKFTTGSDVTASNNPFVFCENASGASGIFVHITQGYLKLYLSSNGTSYDKANNLNIQAVEPNTTYIVKYIWDGESFIVEVNGEVKTAIEAVTAIAVAGADITLGYRIRYTGEYFRGSVDLNECYINLNGSRWWTGTVTGLKHSNGHRFYDIADKSSVDDIFDSTGVAWFYGVDEENERIFLPRSVRYFKNGSLDTVEEFGRGQVPNIKGRMSMNGGNGAHWWSDGLSEGALFASNTRGGTAIGNINGTAPYESVNIDASRSSSVYSDDATTVDVDSTSLLVYMVVGTTEGTSAPIDAIDITTSENDTIPLGFSTYQGAAQPSLAWLAAKDSWEDGNEYVSFFNEFKDKVGQPFCAGFVRNYTDEYTKYDLVINQDGMKFRLPLLNGSENLIDYSAGVELKDSSLPYTFNQKGELLVRSKAVNNNGTNLYINNEMVFESYGGGQYAGNDQAVYSVKNGDTITSKLGTFGTIMFYPAKGNGTLYFKVSNAVQNLEVLNAAETKANMLTRANKAEIVGWGLPDYSAGVVLPSGSAAPSAGFVMLNSGSIGAARLSINGETVLRAQVNAGASHFFTLAPIDKEEIVTATGLGTGGAIQFYPLKGVSN